MENHQIGFLGFGHMGKIIFEALNHAKILPRSHFLFTQRDAHKMKENEQKYRITSSTLANLLQKSDCLVLAVRPQQISHLMQEVQKAGGAEGKWVISILSGTKIAYFQHYLGPSAQILRAMPNIASSVAEGMTVLTYGDNCSSEFRGFGNLLFGSMGEIAEVPESFADITTALTGSGPGFVARLIEAAARLGEKHGLAYPTALKLAAQSFAGAAKLILRGHPPSQLIQDIATPHGVTAAGFEVMNKLSIDHHYQSAIEAAAARSRDLSEDR